MGSVSACGAKEIRGSTFIRRSEKHKNRKQRDLIHFVARRRGFLCEDESKSGLNPARNSLLEDAIWSKKRITLLG